MRLGRHGNYPACRVRSALCAAQSAGARRGDVEERGKPHAGARWCGRAGMDAADFHRHHDGPSRSRLGPALLSRRRMTPRGVTPASIAGAARSDLQMRTWLTAAPPRVRSRLMAIAWAGSGSGRRGTIGSAGENSDGPTTTASRFPAAKSCWPTRSSPHSTSRRASMLFRSIVMRRASCVCSMRCSSILRPRSHRRGSMSDLDLSPRDENREIRCRLTTDHTGGTSAALKSDSAVADRPARSSRLRDAGR